MTRWTVNQREYDCPDRPVVVVCIDGCADEYLSVSLANQRMPRLAAMARDGYRGLVRGALPSFTNVNNASMVTGVSPAVHGISGNFFLDPDSGEEIMMNSASFLRCGTILAEAARQGRGVAMVTAKEKLRDLLSHELEGIAFSSEKAADAVLETHGIGDVENLVGEATPEIYSGEASVYVLKAGAALLEHERADFLYLSLTDYMQHRYPPEAAESLDFYAAIDVELGRLQDLGAVIGITADHGMNAKQLADGSPRVIFLEPWLEQAGISARVILPITDPYVVHHGALGSLAMVHLEDPRQATDVATGLLQVAGITEVQEREVAVRLMELPADRIGDLVVLSGRDTVLGRAPEHHDLSALRGGLRSHGGRYEEMVPLVISEPLNSAAQRQVAGDPRNFDVFDFTINGTRV